MSTALVLSWEIGPRSQWVSFGLNAFAITASFCRACRQYRMKARLARSILRRATRPNLHAERPCLLKKVFPKEHRDNRLPDSGVKGYAGKVIKLVFPFLIDGGIYPVTQKRIPWFWCLRQNLAMLINLMIVTDCDLNCGKTLQWLRQLFQ